MIQSSFADSGTAQIREAARWTHSRRSGCGCV